MNTKIISLNSSKNKNLIKKNLLSLHDLFSDLLNRFKLIKNIQFDNNLKNDLYSAVVRNSKISVKHNEIIEDALFNLIFDEMVTLLAETRRLINQHSKFILNDIGEKELTFLMVATDSSILLKKVTFKEIAVNDKEDISVELIDFIKSRGVILMPLNSFPVSISIEISKKPHTQTCKNVVKFESLF